MFVIVEVCDFDGCIGVFVFVFCDCGFVVWKWFVVVWDV